MADRLYRSRDDRMLAGVAAGVADALDADPSLIRIAWALLAIFTGGIALIVYIVMAIIVPEAPAARWGAMPPPVPPGGPAPGQAASQQAFAETPAASAAVVPDVGPVPANPAEAPLAASPGTPAGTDWPGPAPSPGTPAGTDWPGPAPVASGPASYWTSERDARRATRQTRREGRDAARGGLVVGGILIILGGVFLVRELVPWFDWSLWWPVALIALGGLLLVIALMPGRSSDG